MSWELMLAARHWDVSATARHVAMVLASHANRAGLAWPGLDTVARETGRSRRQVMRAVIELEKAEHITVVRRIGRSSEYLFAPGYPQITRDHPALATVDPGHGVTDPGHPVTNPGHGVTQKNREELLKEESGLSTVDVSATITDIRAQAGIRRHA